MDVSVVETVLTPLLTKYQIHQPISYTDEGLKDTLETIQAKIVEEFRTLENVFNNRISQELSGKRHSKDSTGNLSTTKARIVKQLVYQDQMAHRERLKKIISRAEAVLKNSNTEQYQTADAELGLAEVSMERIVSTEADVKNWTKKSLLEGSMLFSKVLASDKMLAEFLDSLNQ